MSQPSRSTTRRAFLSTTGAAASAAVAAGLTAKSYAHAPGANGRIRIGVIGCGTRGYGTHIPAITRHAKKYNATIAAVCDVWSRPRQGAADTVKESFDHAPAQCSDYRDMLAMKDIDAVMIATPDFQHAKMLGDAADAGKDVFAEKPLAMNMDELNAAYDAVKRADIICQVGTQRRSDPYHIAAREALSTGVLGHISRAEQRYNRNRPNWYIRLPRIAQMKQRDVDFKSFLMHKEDRPFDPLWLCGWYGFREFCSGSIGQFMSHFIDQVHMLTGATFPQSAVAQGGTFTWADPKRGFDCPDHVQTSLIYPEGFMAHFSTNFGNAMGRNTGLFGDRGWLNLDNERAPVIRGEGGYHKTNAAAAQTLKPIECHDHFENWLDCLRTRKTPAAPIDAGYQHAVACTMSDRAYETGRRQVFNKDARTVEAG